jgi:hypothetical protein
MQDLDHLLEMDEDGFAQAWLEIVGEPPAILLSRPVMIEILRATLGCEGWRGRARPADRSRPAPIRRRPGHR